MGRVFREVDIILLDLKGLAELQNPRFGPTDPIHTLRVKNKRETASQTQYIYSMEYTAKHVMLLFSWVSEQSMFRRTLDESLVSFSRQKNAVWYCLWFSLLLDKKKFCPMAKLVLENDRTQ